MVLSGQGLSCRGGQVLQNNFLYKKILRDGILPSPCAKFCRQKQQTFQGMQVKIRDGEKQCPLARQYIDD